MKDLTQRCMAQIRSKSVKYKTEGYYAQDPANPSIIVNYNLDNEKS